MKIRKVDSAGIDKELADKVYMKLEEYINIGFDEFLIYNLSYYDKDSIIITIAGRYTDEYDNITTDEVFCLVYSIVKDEILKSEMKYGTCPTFGGVLFKVV